MLTLYKRKQPETPQRYRRITESKSTNQRSTGLHFAGRNMCGLQGSAPSLTRGRIMTVNALWKLLLVNALFSSAVGKPGQPRNIKIPDSRYGRTSQPNSSTGLSPEFVDKSRMRQTFIAWPAQHSFRLRCKARGQPPLMYQWLKNGDPKFRRRLQPSLRTNSWSMKLKDLIADDSGKYTCIVSNKYGSINHTYTLKVVEKPRTKPILRCEHPKNTTARLGDNATFACVVIESGTLPDFRWLKWKSIPKNYPDLSLEKGSYKLVNPKFYRTIRVDKHFGVQVTIVNVTEEDFGLYTCYVSNHLGFAHKSAFLGRVVDTTKATYSTGSIHQSTTTEQTSTTPSAETSVTEQHRAAGAQVPLTLFIGAFVGWTVITFALALLCCLRARKMHPKHKCLQSDL